MPPIGRVNASIVALHGLAAHNARMMMQTKIIKIEGDAVILLPDELLAQLRVAVGDTLFATCTAEGILLSTTEFDAAMHTAKRIMVEDHQILISLAK